MKSKLLSTLVLILIAVGSAAGQQIPSKGTELLRFALHKKGFTPLTEQQWLFELQPSNDLLIVIVGDTAGVENKFFGKQNLPNALGLRDSIIGGAALLIISDNSNSPRFGGPDWGMQFGITIQGNRLVAPGGAGYRNERDKPFVKPRPVDKVAAVAPFNLFDGVPSSGEKAIATDRPSVMSVRKTANFLLSDLAGYADRTRRADGRPLDPEHNHFAVSLQTINQFNQLTAGRAIIMANRNVFANGMMGLTVKQDDSGLVSDNGNWELAKRTIDWLQDAGGRKRTQCVFIQDGKIIDKFAETVPQPPKPPPPNIDPEVLANWVLHRANDIIPWAEENNYFNRMLESWFGFPRLVRVFLFLVTIVFAVFALRWLRRGFRKVEPSSTITKSVQSGLLPRGGVLRQRTAAQVEVGNLYEAARRRVRSRFDVLGARPGSDGKMPPVLTANDLPDGPLIYQTIRWLWTIGYGESPVTVAPSEWDRVNALLERVSARAAGGDWSFGQNV